MAGSIPLLKWSTEAWLRASEVRGLSPAARGVWFDLLNIMHESDRRGYLLISGKVPSLGQLARQTGCTSEEFSRLLTEIESSGVSSRTEDAERLLYSRRMVRDANPEESRRAKTRERVQRWRRKARDSCNAVCNASVTLCVTESVTKSVTSDENAEKSVVSESALSSKEGGRGGSLCKHPKLSLTSKKEEVLYGLYPRKEGRAAALKAITRALAKESFETLQEAVIAYAEAKAGGDPKFIPHPATWFNQERWKDDRANWRLDAQPRQAPINPGRHRDPTQAQRIAEIMAQATGTAEGIRPAQN